MAAIDTNIVNKSGLITDLNDSYINKDNYSHARNAVRVSLNGDIGTIGNEPSTIKCYSAPYNIIGVISLPNDEDLIFSTNNSKSEIGIGNAKTCEYRKIYDNDCLNFNDKYLIKGVSRNDFQRGTVVYFTDKFNPVRRIELKELNSNTTCDDILLFKKIKHPCVKNIKKDNVGNIPNGVYSIAISYVVDNNIFTDWMSISNRIQLNSNTNSNSITFEINNIDSEFDEYSICLVGNYIDPVTKGATKLAKRIGNFSTKISKISLSDFINSTYEEIKLSDLIAKKKTWKKAGIISSNSNILMFGDLVSREEENYQLKAMTIKSEYVVTQVLADYYEEGGDDIGYYRDENYDCYIYGVYNTGETTDRYHIGGRESTSFDLEIVSGWDVYEYDKQFNDCEDPGVVPRWKVYNTAGKMINYNNPFVCNRRLLGYGKMGYFESTDLYPDNVEMFGTSANKPIRYHKMPDEQIISRYSIIDGKKYINILGIRFYDIPKFDNPDIIGYKIIRSDRKGGNGTVIARGLMTNIRQFDQGDNKILYSNYTLNDLSQDVYLSSTQTVFKNNQENFFNGLTQYNNDKFSFYSPHTLFEPRYSLGTELKIESEETFKIRGSFEKVFNHPKQKLINQFSFWIAAAVGFIESSLVLIGKNSHSQTKQNSISVPPAQIFGAGQEFNIKSVEDLIGLDLVSFIQSKVLAADLSVFSVIKNILISIASLGLKIPYSILSGIRQADQTLDIIYNFTGYTDYVYQYNAYAQCVESKCTTEGNKRRRLKRNAVYVPSTVISVDEFTINNLKREKWVYLDLNKEIKEPDVKDNSRNTISGFGLCNNPTDIFSSVGSCFYSTSKVVNPNQYGQLGSSSQVSITQCVLPFTGDFTTSPILFGGDCIITSFSFQKKMQFFTQNIANTNYPDGIEYDYRLYRNIAYPRYWIDSTKYDFSELLSSNIVNYSKFSRTTTSKHNLDCKKGDKKSITRIDDAYMYLSNNCVVDFIVESDYNVSFREESDKPFYSKDNTNLSEVFRSDKLDSDEQFNINRVYSDIYTTEIFNPQQRYDFKESNRIPTEQPNSVIYSLPSFNLQEIDNWQYFLPANYFAFRESDFGKLTSIHKIDQDRLIFLFSKSSPYISMGRDFLELEQSGRKITIGDGGLFAQDPREIVPTDNNYGACTSRYAFTNTHLGRFYPSENQGRIMNFSESLDDITRNGMSHWCKNYMPIFLYKYFPQYEEPENTVTGVGYLSVFDSDLETVYFTKRDFSPKPEYISDIKWDTTNRVFKFKEKIISLRDKDYFNDISWTLSYSPLDKSFVSWHDWHPGLVIQKDKHFLSVEANNVWKHNESYDSYCKFYDIDYPFEIEFLSSSGQMVETIRSLEYVLEVYKYKNSGRDRFHVHHENFDRLIVRNSEQISPLLNLNYSDNPEDIVRFPRKSTVNNISYDIIFSKEENKYRINQFWDSVKNRGEFNNLEVHLFPTDESGYRQVINPVAIDINKPEEQRKKFRHYFNKFRFIKTISNANKFIVKILNIKKLNSPR